MIHNCRMLFLALAILSTGYASSSSYAEVGSPRGAFKPEKAAVPPKVHTGELKVTVDGRTVRTIPAENVPLHYPDMPGRGDPAIGVAADGTIYAALYAKIFYSKDGGRSWKDHEIDLKALNPPMNPGARNYDSFVVLRDGTLLWAYPAATEPTDFVIRSTDGGRTWQPWGRIEDTSPFPEAGGNQNCMTELPDGTILWPTRLGPLTSQEAEKIRRLNQDPWEGPAFWTTYVYRSTDGGRSWKDHSLLQEWGTETNLLRLKSGRLLAAVRHQRVRVAATPANEPPSLAKADPGDWVGKRVLLADSDDQGRTWKNYRPVWRKKGGPMDIVFGEAHGHLVQLSDGIVVLVHERRYPYEKSDVRARISYDEGQTWSAEVYHLSPGHGYGASVVLPDDTVVTVLGNTLLDPKGRSLDGKYYAQVVRWRVSRAK